MKKIIDSAYINLLQGLSLNLSVKLKNNKLGKKQSSAKGSSVEFSDYRAYSPGDDYRRIDWTALARFEKLFLKLYMEEQQANISIFVDSSRSMGFESKREAEIKLAALFAYTSLSEYDKVSLYFFDELVNEEIQNINTKQGFYRIAQALEDKNYDKKSNLLESVKESLPKIKRGSTIVISDFLYPNKLDEVLRMLNYKKQRVLLCHVLNKDELGVNFEQNVRLKDSETQEELNVDINPETIKLYLNQLESYLKEIQSICQKQRANYFLINADEGIEPFIHQLNKII